MNNITRKDLQPYIDGGYKIIAVKEGKLPEMPPNGFYEAPNTEEYINMVLSNPKITGFGIAGGHDGTVFLDFDDMDYYHKAMELVPELQYYPSELSGKGVHIGMKVDTNEQIGNFQIATIKDADSKNGKKVVIEVKGHHGYVVMAPSQHWGKDGPSGKHYKPLTGDMSDLPVITKVMWDDFVSALSTLNEVPEVRKIDKSVATSNTSFDQSSSEQKFNELVTVHAVLLRNGYKQCPNDENKFRHPDSMSGNYGLMILGDDCCYSHNANDPLCDKNSHNAFDCMRLLECDGDWAEAFRRAEGELGIKQLHLVKEIKTTTGGARQVLRQYGEDLLTTELSKLKFAINNVIPQGMTVLAGSPKIGKSWMALQMCIAVATGGTVLGETCEKGEAVYLSLEDGPRRLKERLMKCLPGATQTPQGLYVMGADSMDPLMEGGLEQLQNWVEDHPDTRLIVIDTMEHIKGNGNRASKNNNAYEADVSFWKGLQVFSQTANISILLITHLKKEQSGGDQFNRVTGSIGITGTADTNILLSRERGSKDAKLLLTCREIEEREEAPIFNTETFTWELTVMPEPGVFNMTAVPMSLSDAIVAVLKEHGELSPVMVKGFLAEDYDITRTADDIRRNLHRLYERKLVDKGGYGKYKSLGSSTIN